MCVYAQVHLKCLDICEGVFVCVCVCVVCLSVKASRGISVCMCVSVYGYVFVKVYFFVFAKNMCVGVFYVTMGKGLRREICQCKIRFFTIMTLKKK